MTCTPRLGWDAAFPFCWSITPCRYSNGLMVRPSNKFAMTSLIVSFMSEGVLGIHDGVVFPMQHLMRKVWDGDE